jgi:hypothetical protein
LTTTNAERQAAWRQRQKKIREEVRENIFIGTADYLWARGDLAEHILRDIALAFKWLYYESASEEFRFEEDTPLHEFKRFTGFTDEE